MYKMEKIVFLQVPDATTEELEQLAEFLGSLDTNYTFIVSNKKMTSLSLQDLKNLVKNFSNNKELNIKLRR